MTDQPFSALSVLVGKITPTWQAIAALAGACSVGVVVGLFLVGFTQIPDRVERMERAVANNTEQLSEIDRQFDYLVCLMTLPENISRETAIRECGV